MPKNVTFDTLADAIEEELTIYNDEIIDNVKEIARTKMSELVKTTRATAPVGRRKKHYRSNITSRKESESKRSVTYVWYVRAPDYRLSHLLNNGHALRNGGRYKGTNFITNASEKILDEYEEEVREVIQKNDS